MTTPKVAIMMPSLNHEAYVEEAIDSIYNQGYSNLQVVVCDDASTDGNFSKLEQLALKYKFLLLRNHERQGIILTLNRCFEHCRDADYFYTLASDDILQPGIIQACLTEIKKWPNAGMLLGTFSVIDGSGSRIGSSRAFRCSSPVTLSSVWEVFNPSFQFQRGGFTRSVYPLKARGNAEDRYLFLSCLLSSFQVVQTNIPFIHRRIHGANISLSEEARTSMDDGWSYFSSHPLYRTKRLVTLRRHMLCCLALPNEEKRRFRKLFSEDRFSVYFILFSLSFFAPFRWIFSSLRKVERLINRSRLAANLFR
jgi:glycosyltransferase involved in cell wall biosynthesis